MMKWGVALGVLAISSIGAALAQEPEAGVYLCTVEQVAGIAKSHLENSGPPGAFIEKEPELKFRIKIVRGPGFTITELPYDGPDANRYEWQTPNDVLHAIYRGDGFDFVAAEDLGFLRIWSSSASDRISFWHSGFAYAGGEDPSIRTSSGTCAREKS